MGSAPFGMSIPPIQIRHATRASDGLEHGFAPPCMHVRFTALNFHASGTNGMALQGAHLSWFNA